MTEKTTASAQHSQATWESAQGGSKPQRPLPNLPEAEASAQLPWEGALLGGGEG